MFSSLFMVLILEMIIYSILFSYSWFHVMVLLMLLEALMVTVFLILNFLIVMLKFTGFFIFAYVTLSIAEASIGMSLLTMMVRSHGNDFMGISIF